MGRLTGKTALITGGSRGMGAATAKAMLDEGAKVLIADILEEEGLQLAEELGDNAFFIPLDVTSKASWQAAVEKANEIGDFSILLNNAGVVLYKTLMDTSETDYMRVIEINQLGVFLGMQAVFESFKANGGGSIINLSSSAGFISQNATLAYTASKFAVRGMTKAAAIEMGKYKIRVNSVHPGGIYTAMHRSDVISIEKANERYHDQSLKRVGMPEEVAALSVFLASDESSYSTGSEFKVDGGMTAGREYDTLPLL